MQIVLHEMSESVFLENIINLSSAEFAQKVVKFKTNIFSSWSKGKKKTT